MKMSLNRQLAICFFLLSCYDANALKTGTTYPILEQDLEVVMQSRAAKLSSIPNVDIKKTSALKGTFLPRNTESNERLFTPFFTLEFDLLGKNGEVLYPKGFTFNPAAYTTLPFTVWIFDESQIDFIKSEFKSGDTLILSSGDIQNVSLLLKNHVYLLDQPMVTRFSLRGVPTRVRQVGAQYQVWEAVANE